MILVYRMCRWCQVLFLFFKLGDEVAKVCVGHLVAAAFTGGRVFFVVAG